uniref:Uncharacterized protein n=1 Tax=Ciona intestinalis TaxID=7719 RepID=F7B9M1_CIOIN
MTWTNRERYHVFRLNKVSFVIEVTLRFKLAWFVPHIWIVVHRPQVW